MSGSLDKSIDKLEEQQLGFYDLFAEAAFAEMAKNAETNCPVSKLERGNHTRCTVLKPADQN